MRIGAARASRATSVAGFSQITGSSSRARKEEVAQRAVGGRIGDDQRVLKSFGRCAVAPSLEKRRDRILVLPAGEAGVDREPPARLEIDELEIAPVRQLELVEAEDLEQNDLVSHARGAPELCQRPVLGVVKIGEDEQETAPAQMLGGATDHLAAMARVVRLERAEGREQAAQMLAARPRRQKPLPGEEADGVALAGDQMRQGSSGDHRVTEFREDPVR